MKPQHTLSVQASQLINQDISGEQATRIGLGEEAAPAQGLCRTCDNRAECTFTQTGAKVLNCDELDYPPSGPDLQARSEAPDPCPGPDASWVDDRDNLIGLCRTCENRFDCRYPKPAGGVWNCDEFV